MSMSSEIVDGDAGGMDCIRMMMMMMMMDRRERGRSVRSIGWETVEGMNCGRI